MCQEIGDEPPPSHPGSQLFGFASVESPNHTPSPEKGLSISFDISWVTHLKSDIVGELVDKMYHLTGDQIGVVQHLQNTLI